MTSSVRYSSITPTALLIPNSNEATVTSGQDYSFKVIRHNFIADEIGANAGQTRHASGCLVFSIKGALIKEIVNFDIYETTDGGLKYDKYGQTPVANQMINHLCIISADHKSLYFVDNGGDANWQVAAGECGIFTILVGNY